MTNYKEILRMYSAGFSQREIAESLKCSRNTVSLCIRRAKERGIELPIAGSVTNEMLHEKLYQSSFGVRNPEYMLPDFEALAAELKKKHVTRNLLWSEYTLMCSSMGMKAYGISQFNSLLEEYLEKNSLSLRRSHNPGEVMEIDWSGSGIMLKSSEDAKEILCHLFVAVLPYSGYFYAEAFTNERIHSWIRGLSNSLRFFEGVPVILRPDNCKTATIKADKYEPDLHTATAELAEYYGTVVIPARVRKPRDKNVVEGSVGFLSRRIIAALRNQVFFSLEEMNQEIIKRVRQLNEEPFTKKPGSRAQLFSDIEKRTLQPLPPKPFELFERYTATVAPDYHVRFDHCYYSVPPKYIGEKVELKASIYDVCIYSGSKLIASHKRGRFQGQIITEPSHVPEKHREVLGWSGDSFRAKASMIGPNTLALMEAVLESREFEVQSYKTCLGILRLKDKYGQFVLEQACKEALRVGIKSYKGVKSIAQTLDQNDSEVVPITQTPESPVDTNLLYFIHEDEEGGCKC